MFDSVEKLRTQTREEEREREKEIMNANIITQTDGVSLDGSGNLISVPRTTCFFL